MHAIVLKKKITSLIYEIYFLCFFSFLFWQIDKKVILGKFPFSFYWCKFKTATFYILLYILRNFWSISHTHGTLCFSLWLLKWIMIMIMKNWFKRTLILSKYAGKLSKITHWITNRTRWFTLKQMDFDMVNVVN